MKRAAFLILVGIATTVAAIPLSAASAGEAPRVTTVTFEKHAVSANTYVGTIGGGGTIDVLVLDRRNTETAQIFSALFRVDVGDKWFATVLRGRFEFATGQTQLRGTVSHGNWLQGAKVREDGQLVGTEPLAFTGTLVLRPEHEAEDG